jgi:hypothetical protein
MSIPIEDEYEYEYEYRFSEYEYEFDASRTGDQREVSVFLNNTFTQTFSQVFQRDFCLVPDH